MLMITLKRLQNVSSTRLRWILHACRYFNGRSPLYPRFVQLLLTYKCNANCSFCYQAPQKKSIPDMTLSDAKTIENNIRKSFTFRPLIHLFGGEPTVNPEFEEILRFFSDSGYRVSMTTNGLNILEHKKAIVQAAGFREIHVSLNDMNHSRVLDALEKLRAEDADNRLYITLNCPITKQNQHELVNIVKIYENSEADCLAFQHRAFIWYSGFVEMDHKAIREQYDIIRKRKNGIDVIIRPKIPSSEIKDYYTDKIYPFDKNQCYFPWFVLFIQPDGTVVPCDELDIYLGNAKTDDLKKVWNNPEYVKFRKSIIKRGISHPICNRCDHREY